MRRLVLFIALFMLIPSLGIWAVPIEPFPDDCQTFDFTTGQHGWAIRNSRGAYSAGVGFIATLDAVSNPKVKQVEVGFNFDDDFVYKVSIFYTFVQGEDTGVFGNDDTRLILRNNGSIVQDLSVDSNNSTASHGWESSAIAMDDVDIRIRAAAKAGSSPAGGSVTIQTAEICVDTPDDPLVRPLASEDEDDWGLFEHPGSPEHTVVAASIAPGAYVYAATAGTVTDVVSLPDNLCNTTLDVSILNCAFRVPDDVHGESGGEWVYTFKEGEVGFTSVDIFEFAVTIQDAGGRLFTYFVEDADEFIVEGTTIQAGCILGRTMNITGYGFEIGSSALPTRPPGDQGVTILAVNWGEDEILPDLQIYPTASNACNVDPEYSDCIGDGKLEHPEDWQAQGNVTWLEPGVQIAPFSSIRTVYNLDAGREPKMRVSARTLSAPAQMNLRLGLTSETFTVSSQQFTDYEIPGAEHEPSSDIFFDVIVSNNSNSVLEVQYLCLSFTLDEEGEPEPPPQPPACYFANNSFNEGTGSWTVSNPGTGVYTYAHRGGEILVLDNQTFSQEVTLYPVDEETPQDYVVRVEASIYHYPTFTLTGSETVEIEYNNGSGYASMGTHTLSDFASQDNRILYVDSFSITTETTATFTFRVQTDTLPSGVEAVAINFACLDTDTGEDFPGYGDDENEPEPPLFPEDCNVIERPSGSAVHHWLAWHWANLNQFFQCDLMVFLNTQYRTLQNFFRTVQWSIRWFQSTLILSVDWLDEQFLPWLGGYLANASGGAIVYQDGEADDSCEWWNVICHLENALSGVGDLFEGLFNLLSGAFEDVIQPLIDAILTLLNTLLSFVFGTLKEIMETIINVIIDVVTQIFNLLVSVRNIVLALIDLWNDTEPETLPGMPTCDVSSDNVMCWVYFVAENTILKEGTTGELIIPLIAALSWILLFFWVLGQILSLVRSSSNAI